MFAIHLIYFTWLASNACFGFSKAEADIKNRCGPGFKTPGWTVPKGDIILEMGAPLEIYCVLDPSNGIARESSAERIVFYNGSQPIDKSYVTVVNQTTAKLNLVSSSVFNEMIYCYLIVGSGNRSYAPSSLENTSPSSDAKEQPALVCLNNVVIGMKPQEVTNFTCISYNWEYLNCSWIPPNNGVRTNYTISYRTLHRASRTNYGCPTTDDVIHSRCTWTMSSIPPYRRTFEDFNITIKGVNKFGNISQNIKYRHYAHIIPAAPQNLEVVSKTTSSIYLRWSIGALKFLEKGLAYKVKYIWDKSPLWNVTVYTSKGIERYEDQVCLNVTDLRYPNIAYDFRIYMRSSIATGEDHWSEPAWIVVKTRATAPYVPPKTDFGSFEISNDYSTHRHILIYWQPVAELEYNGDNFHYEITVFEDGREVNLRPSLVTSFYARFENISYNSYRFVVKSANSNGSSPYSSVINVPSKRDLVSEPVVFKVDYGGGTYELSWKSPNVTDNKLTNFTAFWCESNREGPYQCDGGINWMHLPPNTSKHNFTFDASKNYQFAISANTENSSSGMVWTLCTVLHNKVGKMKNVWVNRVGSYFIDVRWKLDCSDRIESIRGYNIYYCVTSVVEKGECAEPEKMLTVYGDFATARGNITNLKAFSTYKISTAIFTKDGRIGPRSEDMYNRTLDGFPEVKDLKVEVMNISNSSAVVQWEKPQSMNGVFQHYEVHYNDEVATVNDNKLVLAGLTSYSHYTVKVSACTRLHCSELNPIAMHTKIGVPGVVNKPSAQKINSTHVLVTWNQPSLLAGPSPLYDVRVQFDEVDKNSTMQEFETTETKAIVPVPSCKNDLSYISYTYYVRAKNIDDSDPQNLRTFWGDWSPAYTINCIHAGLSALWKIMLGISFFVLFLSFFVFYGKKGFYKCQQMKRVEVTLPPKFTIPPLFQNEIKDQDYQVHIRTWTDDTESDRLNVKLPEIDRTSIDCIDMDIETDRETSRSSSGCYTS